MLFSGVKKKGWEGNTVHCYQNFFARATHEKDIAKLSSWYVLYTLPNAIVSFRHCQLPTYAILKSQLWWLKSWGNSTISICLVRSMCSSGTDSSKHSSVAVDKMISPSSLELTSMGLNLVAFCQGTGSELLRICAHLIKPTNYTWIAWRMRSAHWRKNSQRITTTGLVSATTIFSMATSW